LRKPLVKSRLSLSKPSIKQANSRERQSIRQANSQENLSKTGEFAGKTVVAAGKGVYYVGTVPVKITDKALDTTAKVLTITTQAVDVSGKVITTARTIQSAELEAELAAVKGATNILSVIVDAVS